MALTSTTLFDALLATSRGKGIPPEACEQLIAQGWAAWVDYEFGTPIHHDDPRSWLEITAAGRRELEATDGPGRRPPAVSS